MSQSQADLPDSTAYRPRNPKIGDHYRCVEAHFEKLQGLWDDRYARVYGAWRPYVSDVINRYLDSRKCQE